MKTVIGSGLALGLFVTVLCATRASAGEFDKYIWEAPRYQNIDQDKTAALRSELAYQVKLVLDAPPLGPLRCAYADIPFEAYWLYYERGRVITTLAYAYPYVSTEQQAGIKKYVAALLKDENQQPWRPGILEQNYGAERRLYGTKMREGRYVDTKKAIPTLHVLYGLWLYGDRTGDWETIKANWPAIKDYYMQAGRREVVLYGQMSGHIAVARLAKQFDDADTQKAAVAAAENDFAAGKDPAKIEDREKQTRYAVNFEKRNAGSYPGQPWMFLDASPEIMRFVADNSKDDAIKRIDLMKRRYPLWWMNQAPYGTRWTGDEGKGCPPDLFGMVYNIERWVRQAPPEQLALYMKSVPTGIGDSYWIEGLVQTIESFGTISW